jgi:hypothetical protein
MLGRTAATVMLPCFVMGLQNVLFTKLSNAEIRTTHYLACLPLALLLCRLAIVPALDDLREIARKNSQ